MRLLAACGLILAAGAAIGCKRHAAGGQPADSASASAPSRPPWDGGVKAPAAPDGMVWIPGGALVAGTTPGTLPRIADEEMPGEQVILKGFFISVYPYPNEEGAIPIANATQPEAEKLCEERKQRLCTELEWERACKGPDNHVYEYGDRYRAEVCGTGAEARMLPSGLHVACRSDFGVRDMHGSIGEWTSSLWGRGTRENWFAIRGGNAPAGELVGRCANASGKPPTFRSSAVGFRCCMGPPNVAEVSLRVERKAPLEQRSPVPDAVARRIEAALPAEARAALKKPDTFHVSSLWYWHPIGNEELVVAGGCTNETVRRGCGVVVMRLSLDDITAFAWVASGRYLPTIETDYNPRYLWVYGGDERSHFRSLVNYAWGRVTLGEIQRNVKHVKKGIGR